VILLQFSWKIGLKDLYASGVLIRLWHIQAFALQQFYERFEKMKQAGRKGLFLKEEAQSKIESMSRPVARAAEGVSTTNLNFKETFLPTKRTR
jgi:hypothetical protein